jgi:hypothetical protein
LLDVPYFHVVFTVPDEVAVIAFQNKPRAVQRFAVAGVSLRCHRSGQNGAGGLMAGFPDR